MAIYPLPSILHSVAAICQIIPCVCVCVKQLLFLCNVAVDVGLWLGMMFPVVCAFVLGPRSRQGTCKKGGGGGTHLPEVMEKGTGSGH